MNSMGMDVLQIIGILIESFCVGLVIGQLIAWTISKDDG